MPVLCLRYEEHLVTWERRNPAVIMLHSCTGFRTRSAITNLQSICTTENQTLSFPIHRMVRSARCFQRRKLTTNEADELMARVLFSSDIASPSRVPRTKSHFLRFLSVTLRIGHCGRLRRPSAPQCYYQTPEVPAK